jgi:hypothetical protein
VQVKSGKVNSGHIRDLRGTVDCEDAAIGVFITPEEPSRDMKTEEVSADFYHSPGWGTDYSRLHILTINELVHGGEVKMPPQYGTFKEVPRVQLRTRAPSVRPINMPSASSQTASRATRYYTAQPSHLGVLLAPR